MEDKEFLEWNAEKIKQLEGLFIRSEALFKAYSKWQGVLPKSAINQINRINTAWRGIRSTYQKFQYATGGAATPEVKFKKEEELKKQEGEKAKKDLNKDLKELLKDLDKLVAEIDTIHREIAAGEHLVETSQTGGPAPAGGAATDLNHLFNNVIKIRQLEKALREKLGATLPKPADKTIITDYVNGIKTHLKKIKAYLDNEKHIIDALRLLERNIARHAGQKEMKTVNAINFAIEHFEEDLKAVVNAINAGAAPAAMPGAPNAAEQTAIQHLVGNPGAAAPIASSLEHLQGYMATIHGDLKHLFNDIEQDEKGMITGLQNTRIDLDQIEQMMSALNEKFNNFYHTMEDVLKDIQAANTAHPGAAAWPPDTIKNIAKKVDAGNAQLESIGSADSVKTIFSNLVLKFEEVIQIHHKLDTVATANLPHIRTIIDYLKRVSTYLDRLYT